MMKGDFDWMKEVQDFTSKLRTYFENFERPASDVPSLTPATDVYTIGDSYYVEVELPGVKKEDIRISMSGSTIDITGEKMQTRSSDARTVVTGRRFGAFRKQVVLPTEARVDLDGSTAAFENGVLRIELHSRTANAGSTIPIN